MLIHSRIILSIAAGLLVAACQTQNGEKPRTGADPASPPPLVVESALTKSAHRVSESLHRLSMIEQSRHPVQPTGSVFSPDMPPELGVPVTLSWAGPAEIATSVVAGQIGWAYRTIGNRPSTPVIVSFDAKAQHAVDVLRDIGLQSVKSGAAVILDAENRVIEFQFQARK